jgi:hypothetical protein
VGTVAATNARTGTARNAFMPSIFEFELRTEYVRALFTVDLPGSAKIDVAVKFEVENQLGLRRRSFELRRAKAQRTAACMSNLRDRFVGHILH